MMMCKGGGKNTAFGSALRGKGDDQTVKRHLADRRIPENRWELIETGLRDAQG